MQCDCIIGNYNKDKKGLVVLGSINMYHKFGGSLSCCMGLQVGERSIFNNVFIYIKIS